MQGLEGISSESLQDLERAFGNVLNDMKSQYEMSKQSAANEVRRCGGRYTSCDPGDDVAYIQTGAGVCCKDHTSAPVLLPPESVTPHRAHPFPPSAVTKRYNTLHFTGKVVCQQGCSAPLLDDPAQGAHPA